jgi:hypothetical protein
MAQHLIAQHEEQESTALGHRLGWEVFHDPEEGFYTARFHARTYDGIKVASSHTTQELRLAAETKPGAYAEVQMYFRQFAVLYEEG